MSSCPLDIFPVELLHNIFSYFSSHEILRTFSDVSPYLDAVLLAYPCYRVNFKSIRRTDFDLICQRISPNQVISLTLSDDKNTPGQIQLFLSRFQIDQFIHLRSLTLIDIGCDFWEPIVSKISQLNSLVSFSYIVPTRSEPWVSVLSGTEITKLDKHLFDIYSPVLPKLNRLRLLHGNYFTSTQFPCLRQLTLERCSSDTLKHLCSAAPQLESLDIELQLFRSKQTFIYPFAHLNRLVLKITGMQLIILINPNVNFCVFYQSQMKNVDIFTSLTHFTRRTVDLYIFFRFQDLDE